MLLLISAFQLFIFLVKFRFNFIQPSLYKYLVLGEELQLCLVCSFQDRRLRNFGGKGSSSGSCFHCVKGINLVITRRMSAYSVI